MKPNDKRRNNPGRPTTPERLKLRAHIIELIDLLGGTFKTSDICYDAEVRDYFAGKAYMQKEISAELTRLVEQKYIKRLPTMGWYRKVAKRSQRGVEE